MPRRADSDICVVCKRKINAARQRAMPHTTTCSPEHAEEGKRIANRERQRRVRAAKKASAGA